MADDRFKTGETVPADIILEPMDRDNNLIPIGNFSQITIIYKYNDVKFSFHALNAAEAGIVAEASAENKTVNDFDLNGNVAETTILATDTDTLPLAQGEAVVVSAIISMTDTSGNITKMFDDLIVGTMKKDGVEGEV